MAAIGGSGKGIQIVVGTDYNDRDLKRAQADLNRLKGQAATTAGPMAKLGNTIRANLGPALAMAGAAAGAFALKLAVDGVKAAIEDEAAAAKLAQTLRNLGQAHSTSQVEAYILQLQRATGVVDDEMRPAFERIVRSTGNVEEAQRALALAVDISASKGKSLQSVADALGKAYDGNTVSLGRLGLGLDQTVLRSGNMETITSTLADLFAGQAAVAADTWAGRIQRVSVAFDELKESFGAGVLAGFGDTGDSVEDLLSSMQELEPVLYDLGESIGTLVKALGDFEQATGGVSAVLKGLLDVTGPTLDAILYFYRVIGNGEDPVEALKQQFFGLGEGYGDVADGAGNAAWFAGKAGQVFGTTAGMAGEMADETDDAADALKILNDEMGEFFGFLDERDAVRNYQDAIDELRKSLKENGKSFDVNTEAGRNNEQALDNVFETALKVAEGQATAAQKIATMEAAARTAAAQLDKTKMSDAAKAALLAPFDDAIARFTTANTKVDNLKAAMERLPTRVDITVNTNYTSSGVPGPYSGKPVPYGGGSAYGGFVGGYGGSRADDVPAMLSSGEFVIQAPAVSRFGRGFFAALNQGVNPLQGMTPTVGGSGAGLTINGGITVQAAPGERAETSLPRALRRASFLAGVNG
jgi:hypothetical protein